MLAHRQRQQPRRTGVGALTSSGGGRPVRTPRGSGYPRLVTELRTTGGDTSADDERPTGGPTIAPTPYTLGDVPGPLGPDELRHLDAWWRAANYLAVGQIYLIDNPLLREPLRPEHVKPRLLGHFGTVPGLNLSYAHANRAIVARDLDAVFVAGPGHGGPGPNACAWLEGTTSEVDDDVSRDERGMTALFRRFSFPGGVPSHCAPETPGSFHEGGELGYSLAARVRRGARPPGTGRVLRRRRRRGRDRAAGDQLALQPSSSTPTRDGAVLPILAPQRVQDRQPDAAGPHPRRTSCSRCSAGTATTRIVVAGDDPAHVHQEMASARSTPASTRIAARVRQRVDVGRVADDRAAHAEGLDVPAGGRRRSRSRERSGRTRCRCPRLAPTTSTGGCSRRGCAPYRPEELFDDEGRPCPEVRDFPPSGDATDEREPGRERRRVLLRDLDLPDWRDSRASRCARPERSMHEATRVLGALAARGHSPQPRQLPAVRPRRAGEQPAAGHARGDRSAVGAGGRGVRRAARSRTDA